MYKNHEYILAQYQKAADFFALNLAFLIGLVLRFWNDPAYQFGNNSYLSLLLFTNISWFFVSNTQKIYKPSTFSSKNQYRFAILLAIVIQFLIAVAFNGLIKTFYSRIFILYTYLSFAFLLILARRIVLRTYKAKLHKKGKKSVIAYVASGQIKQELKQYFDENLTAEFQEIKELSSTKGITSELEEVLKNNPVSELYVPLSQLDEVSIEEIANYCDQNFIRLRILFDWGKLSLRQIHATKLSQNTVFRIATTPLDDPFHALVKRSFDLIFTILAFVFLFSWLFPILAIAVKLSSKGPVFFKQKRSGVNNKEFNCYKFRSMKVNEEADLVQAVKGDSRITKLGSILRRTSLDELPQFINVLKGEMSIVGPRPHMLRHTEDYSKIVGGDFMHRHAIKPGITGLAQVKGYRGEIDDLSLLQNRVRLDRFYVNNWSLLLDIQIVIKTVLTVFQDHK